MRSLASGLWWLTKLFAQLAVGIVIVYVVATTPIYNAIPELALLAVGVAVYFAPSIFATRREHPNSLPIIIVNVFFGWTLIGWVVALAWAASSFEKSSAA